MNTFPQLDPFQTRILEGILNGKRNTEIAEEMGLSRTAIDKRVTRLLKKLSASNRGVLIARYHPRESTANSIDFGSLHEEALRVAHLVAAGFTDRKIAEVLKLAPRTVEARVRLWLLKPFGFSSRRIFTAAFLAWKPPATPPLSEEYRKIYEYLLEGMTNAEIASATDLSRPVVASRIARLLKKLRLESREEVIATYFNTEGMQPAIGFSDLTPKAIETARLVAAGVPIEKIARRLEITPSAVSFRIRNWLLQPFGIKNRHEFARIFIVWRDTHEGRTVARRSMEEPPKLTQHQQQLFEAILEGGTKHTIAAQLGISPDTVQVRIRQLCHKLGVADRAGILTRYTGQSKASQTFDFSSLDREAYQTAHLVAAGYTNKEIAKKLHLSMGGVQSRIRSWLLKPFDIPNRYAFAAAFTVWRQSNPTYELSNNLTQQQSELLSYLLQGRSKEDIVSLTGHSRNTVASNIKRLLTSVGVTTRAELIARYAAPESKVLLIDFGILSGEALATARLVAAGKTTKAIARELGLSSPDTIRKRINSWLLKPFGLRHVDEFTVAFHAWELRKK